MKLYYLVLPLAFIVSCKAQAPRLENSKDNNTLLWEISGNNLSRPSYLYGTFHLICKTDLAISKNLESAIKSADEVYFELDLDDPALMMGALLYMNMKDGKQLKDLYTPEEYVRIENFFRDSLSTPLAMIQRMKPMFLQSMLYPKMLTCRQFTGVEQELMKIAKEYNKEIKGLETMQFQASVFDSIPYDVQAKALLKNIDSLDKYKVEFDSLVLLYKSQQLKKIEESFLENDISLLENQDLLLNNRNRNWVSQLKSLMPAKSVVVAVGAGHLVGEKGVIELLKKEGFVLRPIKN